MADFDWWHDTEMNDGDTWGTPQMRWPKEVPWLSRDNISQSGRLGAGDCRCLLGWTCGFPTRLILKVDATLAEIIKERGGDPEDIAAFSDTQDPQDVADLWNEAMHRRGYTEAA